MLKHVIESWAGDSSGESRQQQLLRWRGILMECAILLAMAATTSWLTWR